MKNSKTIYKAVTILVIAAAAYFTGNLEHETVNHQRQKVELAVCVDGDTVRFKSDGQEKKYRLLLIDTPESTKEVEPYGPEASEFTCSTLKNADKIEIEYQEGNDQQDKYGRELVWVFVDGELLQTKIARAGYVKKLYDNHRPFDYKEEIIEADLQAQQAQVGLYSK